MRESSNDLRKSSQPKVHDLRDAGYNRFPPESEEGSPQKQGYLHRNDLDDDEDPRKPYEQVKHVFQIKVKELKNVPVLNKFLAQIENQHDNVAPLQYQSEDVRKK
jgi:hypothetical protein